MTKSSAMNPEVEAYFQRADKWREEVTALRGIILDCGLKEELKWRAPCYTFQGGNVVIIQAFKTYCAVLFFKGALLDDPDGILTKVGENTQAGRQIRFKDARAIGKMRRALKAYVRNAVEVEKSGLKVPRKKRREPIPHELQVKLDESPAFKSAFEALTPGRQRAYILHFSQPKQSKTRTARVERHRQRILDGKGMNDR